MGDKKNSEPKNSLNWNQHPLISTVLWILGTETISPDHNLYPNDISYMNPQDNQNSHGKFNVLWKDQHGGNINEYLNKVQSMENAESKSKTTKATQLNPTVSYNEAKTQVEDKNGDGNIQNQSPQWGFYVPITPPEQEAFARMNQKVTP